MSRDRTGRLGASLLWVTLAALLVTLWPSDADAYPWMIRHGYSKCNSCHTDPSGGETLNSFGRLQADQVLEMRYGDDTSIKKRREFLWGAIDLPSELQLGGSYRHMSLIRVEDIEDSRTFPMQIDLYGHLLVDGFRAGGSIGLGKVPAGSPHVRPAQITQAQGDQLNLISRNHWFGWQFSKVLVRAGRLNLPFGLRIPEHVFWAREATRTDRESDQQHGASVAFTTNKLRGEIMGIAGNYQINPDEFRDRGYSLFLEYLPATKYAVGISSQLTTAEVDRLTLLDERSVRHSHGVTGRLAPVKPLVLMAEFDVLSQTGRDMGYVGFLQADVEPIQGLHFMATGELLDAGQMDGNDPTKGSGEPRLGGWLSVNWFFFSHMDFRVDAVFRQLSDITIQSQLHVYL